MPTPERLVSDGRTLRFALCVTLCWARDQRGAEVMGNLEQTGCAHSSASVLRATVITHAERVIQMHIHTFGKWH